MQRRPREITQRNEADDIYAFGTGTKPHQSGNMEMNRGAGRMSDDDAKRIYDKLDAMSQSLAGLVERLAWVRESSDKVSKKLDIMSQEGCVVGKKNTEAIESMKALQRDTNSIKVGGVVINGSVAVLAVVVAYMVLKMHGIAP